MSTSKITPPDVILPPGESAIFMVFNLVDTATTVDQVKDVCGSLAALVRSMRKREPDGQGSCVMGFGAEAWGKLFPEQAYPKELKPFQAIKGDKHTAPSTPGDLYFHIRARRMDICFELASEISTLLEGAVVSVDETHGFRYFDGRTIIGFVDGTENPEGEDAYYFTSIGDEDKDFAGGSYAFIQKYLHNMKDWNGISTEEQEKVIGRRKFNDIELSDEEKPANAHNAVTNIADDDGNELKVMRANMPFANPSKGEYGTYFISYASTFTTTERMLRNMFIGEPVGNYDRLLDFSTAVTGTLFFIPSPSLLSELGGGDD
ncbi:Dyp-type peroxidase [Entomomonas sp. E2T0]|uniref:Dyp-type peroxidase n=1 Tax=Entomomonas sp. E2T0 TaxID=2930213 RepID=UPI0022282049|nr:Dyp-type peroxidase [Entomomonas sp. E2T0]UYZ85444.1 Dyp-type peroxidase [Entomomonas sp. E2T0]